MPLSKHSGTATWLNPKNCTSKLNLESCFFPMHIAHNYSLCPIFSLNINHLVFMPYSHRSYADAVLRQEGNQHAP